MSIGLWCAWPGRNGSRVTVGVKVVIMLRGQFLPKMSLPHTQMLRESLQAVRCPFCGSSRCCQIMKGLARLHQCGRDRKVTRWNSFLLPEVTAP